MKKRGFTIVELIIVIVVIAILATIVAVSYREVQNDARDTVAKTDLRNLYDQITLYQSKHKRKPSVVQNATISADGLEEVLRGAGIFDETRYNKEGMSFSSPSRRYIFCYSTSKDAMAVAAHLPNGGRSTADTEFWYADDTGLKSAKLTPDPNRVGNGYCTSIRSDYTTFRWSYDVPLGHTSYTE